MNPTILNRDFQHPADGWYQIEAKGNHANRAAGVLQVIDDAATQSIVNRFNADAKAGKLRHGSEMLIDHEHFSDQEDQESRAYGWLQELTNREDGIYGRIRWTATGKPAVDGGDYRFFSTEYSPADCELVKAGIGNRKSELEKVRPMRLAGLTLTNMNNNRGQKPITNADRGTCPDCNVKLSKNAAGKMECPDCKKTFAGVSASADTTETNQNTKNRMKTVCTLLGLSADADEASVHAEVTKLKNRISTLEPLEADNTKLKNRLTALDGEQVDGLLDLHGVGEEKIRNRLKPMLADLDTRAERVAALVDLGHKPIESKRGNNGTRTLNRGTGEAEGHQETAVADEEEQEFAQKIHNRAQELKGAAPTRSFDSCWNQAKGELTKAK